MTVEQERIVEKTADHVKDLFSGECTGHDWWHIYRVWQMARRIGREESADLYVVELAALLHDIADWKFHNGDDSMGPLKARAWLQSADAEERVVNHVTEIIATMSFRGANVPNGMHTLEGKVVQDADRLDAIGAVGIARTFAYGGFKGRPIHDPACAPQLHDSYDAYKNNAGPTVAHFYEKLLLLKDRFYTSFARELAAERHAYMEAFLERFYAEWDGEK